MLHRQHISPVMAGRRSELEALCEMLVAAQGGTGSVALVGGDAGIGKTRLCRALKSEAANRHVRVIEGRCSPAESSVPYGPFMDALRFRLSKGEGAAAARVLEPVLGHLTPLFSSLASADEVRPAEATAQPFETIFGVFRRLGELGPVVLILEDIHWADATSRDLLHHLARQVGKLPLLLVATYRTDEMHPGHPIHRLAAALTRERATLRIQLEPLRAADVQQILQATMDVPAMPEVAEAVCRRTEGNPLFVEELIGVILQSTSHVKESLTPAEIEAIPLPGTVHELVWERVGRLSADAREAVTVAAVIGRRFRFDVLGAAMRWPPERLLKVIEELVAHHVVAETRDDDVEYYTFQHSLVQEVLYASTIGRRRREWHRRVAAAFEQAQESGGLSHTTLAHHYTEGGDFDRARVHLLAAGDEAASLCAWKDAESMYEEALAALERSGGDAPAEADILERMADVAGWQDRISAVEQYAGEALAIRRAHRQDRHAARLLRRLASIDAHQRGEHDRAVVRLRDALDLVQPHDPEYACLLNDLGRLHMRQGQTQPAEALFDRALKAAAQRSDCAEEAVSLVLLGGVAVERAEITTALARLDLAFALLSSESLPVDRRAQIFHAGLATIDAMRQQEIAHRWAEAALEFAVRHGARGEHAVYRAYRAAIAFRAGEWDSAQQMAHDAVAELRANGRAELRDALRILGDIHRGRGELEAARSCYSEAIHLMLPEAAVGLALLAMAEHRWGEAADDLNAALANQPEANRLFKLRVLPHLVEATLSGGRMEEARRHLDRLRILAADSDDPITRARLAQAAAMVAAADGASDRSVRELRSAVSLWHTLSLPYETMCARLLLAEQLVRRTRSRDEGIQVARDAAAAGEELGAPLELARAHHVLRLGGVRRVRRRPMHSPVPAPLAPLTPREREVLFELARGRTNKQIARTLSLSPRTVGNHVSAILAKLGCATRTEAARLVPPVQAPLG